MRAIPLGVLAALALGSQAAAQQAASADAKPRKARIICRADTTTGSRISRTSICATQEEWDEIDKAQAANTQSMLSRMSTEAGNQPTVELMDPSRKALLMPDPRSPGF